MKHANETSKKGELNVYLFNQRNVSVNVYLRTFGVEIGDG